MDSTTALRPVKPAPQPYDPRGVGRPDSRASQHLDVKSAKGSVPEQEGGAGNMHVRRVPDRESATARPEIHSQDCNSESPMQFSDITG